MLPPGLGARAVRPLMGVALDKANLPLDKILEQIKTPGFLPVDPVLRLKELNDKPSVEPPIAAMFAYIQARMAWDQRRLFEARQHLERALTLSPDSEHLLTMLAQLWATAGNQSRSTAYLQKVVELDPLNMKLLLQLGAFALDQNRYEDAIGVFNYVQKYLEQGENPDLGLRPLAHYYLAVALDRAGYVFVAMTTYREFLATKPDVIPRDPREARRLELLLQQQGLLWRQMGDNYCQLQKYDQALEAYRTAVTVGVSSKIDIYRRLVYVCLKVQRPDLASASVFEILQSDEFNPNTVALIRFMSEHVQEPKQWMAQIQTHLNDKATDSSSVMLLVDLFEPKVAAQMVQSHLKSNPGDLNAIKWLFDHLKINDDSADLQRALDMILTAMMTRPQKADVYSVLLVSQVKDTKKLQQQITKIPDDEKNKALKFFLLAQTHARSGDLKQAQAQLENAIQADDQLTVARVRLAVLFMSLKQFDQADQVLKQAKDPSDPRVVGIRVKLLTQAKRFDEALDVLDQAIALRQKDIGLIMQKAQLQIQMNKVDLAERTLLDALNMNPLAEPIYETLFELYDRGVVADATEQYKRLMMRVLKTIPNSRVARLHFALALASGSDHEQAQNKLLELLKENPKDYRVLGELLEIYRRNHMTQKADDLLKKKLEADPKDRMMLMIAQAHFQQSGQLKRWFELTEYAIRTFDKEPVRSLRLGSLYIENNQVEKGVLLLEKIWDKQPLEKEVGLTVVSLLSRGYVLGEKTDKLNALFQRAIIRYKEHDADLYYSWALSHERLGHSERNEKLMLLLLEKYPDHGPANNGLGYTWVNQGKNLEQAHKMILKAVESDPKSAAYLDSLGWVLYKLQKYDDAVNYLKQSQKADGGDYPVILDHLGDAQYRAGHQDQAARSWQRALRRMKQPEVTVENDPEVKGLEKRLKAKVKSLTQKQEVPVAEIGNHGEN